MAWVIGAPGIGDADDWPIERVVGVARAFYECLAQEERKVAVSVAGEPHAEAFVASGGRATVVALSFAHALTPGMPLNTDH